MDESFEIDFDYLRAHIRWLGRMVRESANSGDIDLAHGYLDQMAHIQNTLQDIADDLGGKI